MKFFKNRKSKERITDLPESQTEFSDVFSKQLKTDTDLQEDSLENPEGRSKFLKETCEQIMESVHQIEEAKIEYQAVTSYLSDMQKIDSQEGKDRSVMEDAARRIITLTKERTKYQNREMKITNQQFQNLKRYDHDMIKIMKQMKEREDYDLAVKNDMRHLEGEKKRLKHQKKEIIEKQKYLKNLAVITFILVGVLFILFIAISYVFSVDMLVPYLMTIIMAAASAAYIFYEARKNRYDIQIVERKLSKAIGILNKVKIKFINNTNTLDYSYEKYGVHNSQELKYMWDQYLKAREADKRYRQNTDMLNRYNEILIEEMKKIDVADPEIWIYQAAAILDQRELVEIRHRLHVRRQKLREQIEYNTNLRETGFKQMDTLLKKDPSLRNEAIEILKEYDIHLS